MCVCVSVFSGLHEGCGRPHGAAEAVLLSLCCWGGPSGPAQHPGRTRQQLDEDAAQRPDVAGEGPAQAQDDLGRTAPGRGRAGGAAWARRAGAGRAGAARLRRLPRPCGAGAQRSMPTAALDGPVGPPVVPGAHNGGVIVAVKGGAAEIDDTNLGGRRQPLAHPAAATAWRGVRGRAAGVGAAARAATGPSSGATERPALGAAQQRHALAASGRRVFGQLLVQYQDVLCIGDRAGQGSRRAAVSTLDRRLEEPPAAALQTWPSPRSTPVPTHPASGLYEPAAGHA